MKKYLFVFNDLKNKIISEFYPVGSELPSEKKLGQIYGASAITIRRALLELVLAGYIQKHQGKGSFVKKREECAEYKKRFISLILVNTISSLINIVDAIDTTMSEYGYSVTIHISNSNPLKEREFCQTSIRDGASGIIIFPIDEKLNEDYFSSVILNNYPIIFIDKHPQNIPCNFVATDGYQGLYHLTNHAIANGHKNFAFLSSITTYNIAQRFQGFLEALKEHHIPLQDGYHISYENIKTELPYNAVMDYSAKYVEKILQLEPKPTCLVCSHDLLAISIISRLRKLGFLVPSDFSVTGFDNLAFSENPLYNLTTVNQDFYQMGKYAAQILLDRIQKKSHQILSVHLQGDIIKRKSLASI